MNTPPAIFIASSSEGNEASNAIETELKRLAGPGVLMKHWKTQFKLSKAYIESLEALTNSCDFGIFVLTADDLLFSRKKNTRSQEIM